MERRDKIIDLYRDYSTYVNRGKLYEKPYKIKGFEHVSYTQ